MNASLSVFLRKKNKSKNKIKIKTKLELKPRFFWENSGNPFVENAMILTCAKIQRKILTFGEVGAPESSFWD